MLLDEIGEIPPAFQAKLLRVIQEGEFERVGGTKTLKVDVRLIFATNKDLEMAVRNGEFREDLYYRISAVPVTLPPLRQRDGDIPLLARAFLQRFNEENGRDLHFAPSALDHLSKCKFPGNVRELENCVQRTATRQVKDDHFVRFRLPDGPVLFFSPLERHSLFALPHCHRCVRGYDTVGRSASQ